MNMPHDVAVIGAGFGGLSAALELADAGARVIVFEALKYPGGCASTFSRWGATYESGATLFSGFAEGQLFHDWIERYSLPVQFQSMDPLVEIRSDVLNLQIPRDRDALIDRLCSLPAAPERSIRRFFSKQKRVADLLWRLFDEHELLPPFGLKELVTHIGRFPHYVELLPLIATSMGDVLRSYGLGDFKPIWTYLNAISQITIQTDAEHAEAPFAMASMDYYFRGTGHIHGGIGELAWALLRTIESKGADLRMADAVESLTQQDGLWKIKSRRGEVLARYVVANTLPQSIQDLCGTTSPSLTRLSEQLQDGWGAGMLYLQIDNPELKPEAHHLELIDDSASNFIEGNHIFASISGSDENRSNRGHRTVTASTHIPMRKLLALTEEEKAVYVGAVQDRMRETLLKRAPEIALHSVAEMTGSPRTFERFTRRTHGLVGGIPRRAGWGNYLNFWPQAHLPNLYLVGDSVFPGQSTLATALGGVKVAGVLSKKLKLHHPARLPSPSLSTY